MINKRKAVLKKGLSMSSVKDLRSLDNGVPIFIINPDAEQRPLRVGLLLTDLFSLSAFSTAVDAFVTAHLMCENNLFYIETIGLNSFKVRYTGSTSTKFSRTEPLCFSCET